MTGLEVRSAVRSQRIAFIEDDADIRLMVADLLREEGFTVTALGHPRTLPRTWRGDVIVTDTFGARYRSTNVARTVRSLRGRHGAAVIVLSAHSEVVRDADAIGADAVLAKPFDLDTLLHTIDEVLRARSV